MTSGNPYKWFLSQNLTVLTIAGFTSLANRLYGIRAPVEFQSDTIILISDLSISRTDNIY